MGSVLHANAKTTRRIREEIQASSSSLSTLANDYQLNPKTIVKWQKSETTEDKKSGPKASQSVLSELEQAAIGEVRRQTGIASIRNFSFLHYSINKLGKKVEMAGT